MGLNRCCARRRARFAMQPGSLVWSNRRSHRVNFIRPSGIGEPIKLGGKSFV